MLVQLRRFGYDETSGCQGAFTGCSYMSVSERLQTGRRVQVCPFLNSLHRLLLRGVGRVDGHFFGSGHSEARRGALVPFRGFAVRMSGLPGVRSPPSDMSAFKLVSSREESSSIVPPTAHHHPSTPPHFPSSLFHTDVLIENGFFGYTSAGQGMFFRRVFPRTFPGIHSRSDSICLPVRYLSPPLSPSAPLRKCDHRNRRINPPIYAV